MKLERERVKWCSVSDAVMTVYLWPYFWLKATTAVQRRTHSAVRTADALSRGVEPSSPSATAHCASAQSRHRAKGASALSRPLRLDKPTRLNKPALTRTAAAEEEKRREERLRA